MANYHKNDHIVCTATAYTVMFTEKGAVIAAAPKEGNHIEAAYNIMRADVGEKYKIAEIESDHSDHGQTGRLLYTLSEESTGKTVLASRDTLDECFEKRSLLDRIMGFDPAVVGPVVHVVISLELIMYCMNVEPTTAADIRFLVWMTVLLPTLLS